MKPRLLGTLFGLVLAGCAPAGGIHADPVVAIADSAPALNEAAGARPTEASGACSLETESWLPDGDGAPLLVAGQAFFQIQGGSLELKLSATVPADAIPARVASGGVSLRGSLSSQHLGLYLRRPVIFEDAVVPTAQARLSWSGVSDGGIVVTHELAGGVEGDRMRATVPCRDLALTNESFELPLELYDPARGRHGRLRDDRRIPLATAPGGAPIAWLDTSRYEVEGWSDVVRELSFDGHHSRIAWKRDRELIFGWVPGDSLIAGGDDDYGEGGGGTGFGLIGTLQGSEEPDARRRCKQNIELYASFDGGPKRAVGAIDPGTPFEVIEGDGAPATHAGVWIEQVFDQALVPTTGVELWVTSEALARCGPPPR